MKVEKEETFAEMFQSGIDEQEVQCLTTVVISSKRAGHSMDALERIQELAKRSGRILSYTKMYDDVYLDRFANYDKGVSPNRNSGRFHQFVLKSNYSLEELTSILDCVNFPEYSYYSDLTITDISL